MATEDKENPYEGLGTGGKFRKRPFRRSQTTPYDRPPTSLRNPNNRINHNNNGWFSKMVVDPAQKLIAYSAHSLFSSLFRKRLPPPPTTTSTHRPSSSEAKQEERDNCQEEVVFVADNSSGKQQTAVGEKDVQISGSDGGELTELEKLLKQKTFTRYEIDHLTALMRSRTVDAPVREEEKQTEVVASEPMLAYSQKEEYPKTPTLQYGIENHSVVAPYVTPSVPVEDVASPAELAKAYMGSRPSKISSSMLGMQSPSLRNDPTPIKNENFPRKSPIMSIVPRARLAGVHENGFVTPRSHGRSAIYSMARTPYARIYPTSSLKGGGLAVQGEPSSASKSALDREMLSGSKLGATKRRISTLDNDIGSVGPIRRVRQKSNLLYSKGLSSPLSGSSLSIAKSGAGFVAAQQPSSSIQKPLLDDVKHSQIGLPVENVDGTIPSTSIPPLPSKSSEMASKIFQQLDKFVSPEEKSSKLRLSSVNDQSPFKLSPSMLRGQALRSIETIDSSKLLDSSQDSKQNVTVGNSPACAQNLSLQIDKVENGPLKLDAPSDGLVPVVNDADATNPSTQFKSNAKSLDSVMIKSDSHPPQKKRTFRMSAQEDFVDLDDDVFPNGMVSYSPVEKEKTSSTSIAEKTPSSTGAIAQVNPPTSSVVMPSKTIDGEAHVGTANETRVGEKVDVSTTLTPPIFNTTVIPVTVAVTAATETSFGSDKPSSPNRSITNPPLFNFGNKVASSTGFTATGAPSNEISKPGPIFSSEKVPQVPFTSSVGGESTSFKFGASLDSKLGSSNSSTFFAGATDTVAKVCESDKADAETNKDAGFSVSSSEPTSLLKPPNSVFTFGQSSNQNNGSLASSPSLSSPFSSLVSSNSISQNTLSSSSLASSSSFTATVSSTGTSLTSGTTATVASSNSSSFTPVLTSSSTTSFFKFGSSAAPSLGLPVSSSGSELLETKSRLDAGVGNLSSAAFGSSSAAVGSTGTGIFGFSSSSMTTGNSQSQGSVFGVSSGSVPASQASAASGFAASTQTQSVSFGLSPSSPSFGLTGNSAFSSGSSLFPASGPATTTSFSSGSSLFPSSSPSTNTPFSTGSSMFPSSSSANIFSSGTTFGFSTCASPSTANSLSSNSGTSSSSFASSSWQPSNSPFGSVFGSSSSSGFSFGSSASSVSGSTGSSMFLSTNNASTPQFSFTSSAATTSTQPALGSPSPGFAFGSAPVNNDQMSVMDSMAEDTVQAAPPAAPVFGQQPAPVQSNFVFGASAPSGASPFQFGSQQNIAPQSPSPFQASGSLEFNAGGSFSLGTGGVDKSGRKFVKVKHKQRKK